MPTVRRAGFSGVTMGLAGAAALAVGLAGCGAGGSGSAGGTGLHPAAGSSRSGGAGAPAGSPTSVIAAAYQRTNRAGSARISLTEKLASGATAAGAGTTTSVTAAGITDLTSQRMRVTETLGGTVSARIDVLMLGYVEYMRTLSGPAQLPGGKTWTKIDLNALMKEQTGAGASAIQSGPGAGSGDFSQTLAYLQGVSSATKVGSEEVRGAPATRYRVNVDFTKVAATRTGTARAAIEKLIGQLGRKVVPIDVWIDGQGRVTQIHEAMSLTLPQSGGHASVDAVITMYDFGVPLDGLTPPPAGQVEDLTNEMSGQAPA